MGIFDLYRREDRRLGGFDLGRAINRSPDGRFEFGRSVRLAEGDLTADEITELLDGPPTGPHGTPLLDRFNRPDGPLGSSWTDQFRSPEVRSHQFAIGAGQDRAQALWAASFLPPWEVYAKVVNKVPTGDAADVELAAYDNGSDQNGYSLDIGNGSWYLFDSPNYSTIYDSAVHPLAPEDELALAYDGTVLQGLHRPAGGEWVVVVETANSDFATTALHPSPYLRDVIADSPAGFDDFGGGSY